MSKNFTPLIECDRTCRPEQIVELGINAGGHGSGQPMSPGARKLRLDGCAQVACPFVEESKDMASQGVSVADSTEIITQRLDSHPLMADGAAAKAVAALAMIESIDPGATQGAARVILDNCT